MNAYYFSDGYVLYGYQLKTGDVLCATDLYAAPGHGWKHCPIPGYKIDSLSTLTWIRPVPEPETAPPKMPNFQCISETLGAVDALKHINRHRARYGQRLLDPVASGWLTSDIVAEAERLGWAGSK